MRNYVKRITKKAEKLSKEQLLSVMDDLAEENESLYSLIESISTGLLIIDNNFYLKQSNTMGEIELNFAAQDENKKSELQIWDLIDDPQISKFLKKCYQKGITNSLEEFSTTTSGGSVRFLSISMTPFIRNNVVAGRVLTIRDITEHKNREVYLHRMENMANLTNLAAGMAHDIKNPLGAISIHIQLIQKALMKARNNENILPPKKFVEDHIDVVNEEIDHLNNIVMDFLFAVRPINAKLELKNPAECIQNMIDFIKPEFNDNKIDVMLVSKDSNSRIMIDEKLLRDVIINFAQNSLYAIKAQQNKLSGNIAKTYKGLFQLECYSNGNKYYIKISDNGCGMSQETVSKIFEPYYTTKSSGTGLGMTMIYKIIKEFSGDIQVSSEEGKGSQFIMAFPLHQDERLALQN